MLRVTLLAIVFCLTGMIGQIDAQCSGTYSSFSPSSNIYDSTSSCSTFYPTRQSSSYNSSFLQPTLNSYAPSQNYAATSTAARLPTPAYLNSYTPQNAITSYPTPSYAAPVVSNIQPSIQPSFPVSIPAAAPPVSIQPSFPVSIPAAAPPVSFQSGFGNLNFAQPSCANGNCPYR